MYFVQVQNVSVGVARGSASSFSAEAHQQSETSSVALQSDPTNYPKRMRLKQ